MINLKNLYPYNKGFEAKKPNNSRDTNYLACGCDKIWQKPELLCMSAVHSEIRVRPSFLWDKYSYLEKPSIVRMSWDRLHCLSFLCQWVCAFMIVQLENEPTWYSVKYYFKIFVLDSIIYRAVTVGRLPLSVIRHLSCEPIRRNQMLWESRVTALASALHDSLHCIGSCHIPVLYPLLRLWPVFSLGLWSRHSSEAVTGSSLRCLPLCSPRQVLYYL